MFNTINILTINCDPHIVLALNSRPPGWPLRYNLKSIGPNIIPKIISAGAWDVVILADGAGEYAEVANLAKAPLIVLTSISDYSLRSQILSAGAARCYAVTDIEPCLFILHHTIDNVVREHRKSKRMEYLQAAVFDELRKLISECSNCHRWRHPVTEKYISPAEFLEAFDIYLTSGICPDCRQTLYGHLEAGSGDG